jgi:hypothetical protein
MIAVSFELFLSRAEQDRMPVRQAAKDLTVVHTEARGVSGQYKALFLLTNH